VEKSTLVLYMRNKCHLCELARESIQLLKNEFDFSYMEVDIDQSDELTEKYGIMIPVVEIDGEEVQFGHIDSFTISEALMTKGKTK